MVPVATIARAKESYGITNKLQKNEIVFERKNMPKDVTTIVESVSQQLVELNPTIKDIKWLFLISEKGCEKQVSHCDNNVFTTYMEGRKRNNRLGFNVPFSVLCALEDSDKNPTHLYLHSTTKNKDSYEDRRVTLSRGGCAIFRGDQWHSGSEYDKLNIRLFIGVGTYACPYESEDVYYFENEETDEEEEDHVIKVNN